jgi:murein DD-endopeptidase MepM/ murein hydrolase activator NlpD
VKLTWIIIFLLFISLVGCSHLKSGHYITLKNSDTLETLSQDFKVPAWQLELSNQGKPFKTGKPYFIPLKRGLISHKSNSPAAAKILALSDDFTWPVPSSKTVSSNFGKRWGRRHEGIDIPARTGANILATQGGVVVYSGSKIGGYGNITVISHPGGFFSVYAHADKNYTMKGQKVHKGQVIALVGTTGRSTGPHLHFEIRHDSVAIDPKRLLKK